MSTDVLIVNIKQTAMEMKGKQSEESSALFMHQLVTLADLDHCDTRAQLQFIEHLTTFARTSAERKTP